MIKAIAIDFDGTIADTEKIIFEGIKKVAKEYGKTKFKNISSLKNYGAKKLMKKELGIKFYQLPKFKKQVAKAVEEDLLKKTKLFRGIKRVWEELSHHYTVGIISSNKEFIVREVLKRAGIENIDFVITSSSLFGKHRLLRKMLKKLKLKTEEAIYIGDEIRDINACKSVGVRMIAVSWGFNSKKALKKEEPTYLIERPSQIIKILVPEKFFEFKKISSIN